MICSPKLDSHPWFCHVVIKCDAHNPLHVAPHTKAFLKFQETHFAIKPTNASEDSKPIIFSVFHQLTRHYKFLRGFTSLPPCFHYLQFFFSSFLFTQKGILFYLFFIPCLQWKLLRKVVFFCLFTCHLPILKIYHFQLLFFICHLIMWCIIHMLSIVMLIGLASC